MITQLSKAFCTTSSRIDFRRLEGKLIINRYARATFRNPLKKVTIPIRFRSEFRQEHLDRLIAPEDSGASG